MADIYELSEKLTKIANDNTFQLLLSGADESKMEDVYEELTTYGDHLPATINMLENLTEQSEQIAKRILDDINELLNHEMEVFDPLVDGPVEHSEGMAMTQELIQKYFKTKFDVE